MKANTNEGVGLTPTARAISDPDRLAIIVEPSGSTETYGVLDDRSARIAGLLHDFGLSPGDHIAFLTGNHPATMDVCWAAQRSGLYWTPLNTRWTAPELAHVLRDSDCRALFVAPEYAATALEASRGIESISLLLSVAEAAPPLEELNVLLRDTEPIDPELQVEGRDMLYSSGTTGTPKGVRPGAVGAPYGTLDATTRAIRENHRLMPESVFLAATPLYHVAALASVTTMHRIGGLVVVMERFDPIRFLEAVQEHRVTHTMVVPTILKRLNEVPVEVRAAYDLSSLQFVGHGGAPCPIQVKRDALEWLGPIVYDCWGATERPGLTMIGPEEWLLRPGSIGRPISGRAHVLDEAGIELPSGEIGLFYWEGNEPFEYHNDPVKTAKSRDAHGWTTVGDMGFIDDDGYLFLTDRMAHMIISGGENVYPVEVENALHEHPAVRDAGVVGRPDDDLGQRVTAFIELSPGFTASDELAQELVAFCRTRLAGYKCPRAIEFRSELPRTPTGKLAKHHLV